MDKSKIDKPESGAEVGKILAVKQVNEDGTMVVEWIDAPSGESVDVQINGTSIVQDGVANIPISTDQTYGVIKLGFNPAYGITKTGNQLITERVNINDIKNRINGYKIIGTGRIDQAVKHALCDTGTGTGDEFGKALIYTPEEQEQAQIRLGLFSAEGVGF